jgi:hypothetical protein
VPKAAAHQAAVPKAATEPAGPDTDNVQQGDQNAPDTGNGNGNENNNENGNESENASDGPGGWADTSANADTQQTGEH